MKALKLLAFLLAIAASTTQSEVLRSVDNYGNVTYSDEPVPGSVEISPIVIDHPVPSPQQVSESERQAQEMIQRANRDTTPPSAVSDAKTAEATQAQQQLDAANAHLQDMQTVRPEDRQSLANGGSRLKPEYLQALDQAEQQVQQAQENLNKAQQ